MRLPPETSQSTGSIYEHVYAAGALTIQLAEAKLENSASRMQSLCELLRGELQQAEAAAQKLERRLSQFRRRNPLAGVRG